MLRRIAPAQIVVRCGFCATNVGPQNGIGRNEYGMSSRGMGSGVAGKVSGLNSLYYLGVLGINSLSVPVEYTLSIV
jgi:hypothetical protein